MTGNTFNKTTTNATSIISKVISAKRNVNINQNKDSSTQRQNPNTSTQATKATNMFSPCEGIVRKNDTQVVSRNLALDKSRQQESSRIIANQLPNQLHQNNDTINNMKKQLQKNRSLQSFFNTTQNLTQRKLQIQTIKLDENKSRDNIRRGSKFIPCSINSGMNEKLSQTSTLNPRAEQQVMTRIKSAFLHFNQTQPSLLINRTEIDLRDKNPPHILLKSKLIQQSPSVSSDEDSDQEGITNTHKRILSLQQDTKNLHVSHISNNSKKPNGSFIEQKMKNALQSRNNNNEQQSLIQGVYQTYNGNNQPIQSRNPTNPTLTKIQSQPQLHKVQNMTQRNAQVKTSFLNRKESSQTSHTPVDIKTPIIKQAEQILSSKQKQPQMFKGDMKSLNLSPIVPQNINKNNQYISHQSHEKTIDTTIRNLDTRKDSCSTKNQSVSKLNTKSVLSTKKEGDYMKPLNTFSKEPSTEKKVKAGFLSFNAKQNVKAKGNGYNSQETERGPGAINSYSTSDEIIQIVPMFDYNVDKDKTQTLRIKDKNNIIQEKSRENSKNSHQSATISQKHPIKNQTFLNNQNVVKVNQILTNNNMTKNSRYQEYYSANPINDKINQQDSQLPSTKKTQQQPTITPRAIPEFGSFVETVKNTNNIKISLPKDDDKTLKKSNLNQNDSSSDDDMPDAKDFEEFYYSNSAYKKQKSQNDLYRLQKEYKVRQFNLENVPSTNNNNIIMKNYQEGSTSLLHRNGPFAYDDRNSLVNYDTSLLTHNTGRDQSPFSYMRPSKPDDTKTINQDPNSFIFTNEMNRQFSNQGSRKVSDQSNYDQDEEPIQVEFTKQDPSQTFKDYLTQIQKEEEQVIEKVTKRIISSNLYKQMNNDNEKAKYLSDQILEVRKYYKQLFIENVLKQANLQH